MKFWNKINVHPVTLLLVFIGLLSGYFKYMFLIFIILLIHELGHIFFMFIFKRKISKITILPFGGIINIDSKISENIFEDLLIDIGGIFFQVIFGWILLYIKENMYCISKAVEFLHNYNNFIIIFNLLPMCPLDGYRILRNICEIFFPYKISLIISIILSMFLFTSIIMNYFALFKDNIFIFVFIMYMCILEIRSIKYMMMRLYLERMNHEFAYKEREVYKKEWMYKNYTNYICGVHEMSYLNKLFTKKIY